MSDEERRLRSARVREMVSLPFLLLPRTPSSSLLSLPCADAQGWKSTSLDNARKFRMKFTVADPFCFRHTEPNRVPHRLRPQRADGRQGHRAQFQQLFTRAPQSEPIKEGQNHARSEAHPLQNQILGAFTFGTFVYFRTGHRHFARHSARLRQPIPPSASDRPPMVSVCQCR